MFSSEGGGFEGLGGVHRKIGVHYLSLSRRQRGREEHGEGACARQRSLGVSGVRNSPQTLKPPFSPSLALPPLPYGQR
jgi:hypothetical protein